MALLIFLYHKNIQFAPQEKYYRALIRAVPCPIVGTLQSDNLWLFLDSLWSFSFFLLFGSARIACRVLCAF